ncbi:MAG: hypothetical protein ACRC7O_10925 [Fimbriiglobus sp.]
MAKRYSVTCECGQTTSVTGTAAGSRIACRCGKSIDVPSLAELKHAAGERAGSADFALTGLLLTGRLPLEQHCVLCDHVTDNKATYHVVCERPEVGRTLPGWQWALLLFLSPFAWAKLLSAGDDAPVHGRSVSFRLPIRVCEFCVAGLTTHAAVRDAFCRTPVYTDLFEKYPHSLIRNAD